MYDRCMDRNGNVVTIQNGGLGIKYLPKCVCLREREAWREPNVGPVQFHNSIPSVLLSNDNYIIIITIGKVTYIKCKKE